MDIARTGNIVMRLLRNGEFRTSISLSEKALTFLNKKAGEKNIQTATFCSYIGNAYSELGEFEKALSYFFKALNVFINLKDKILFDEAAIYNNIATCFSKKVKKIDKKYVDRKDIINALTYYKKSLDIYLRLYGSGNKVVADLYNNLGLISTRSGQFENAKKYFNKSFNIYFKLYGNGCIPLAISFFNTGLLYRETNDFKKAEIFAKKSLRILSKYRDFGNFKVKRYNFLAWIYLESKNYNKAFKYIELGVLTINKPSENVLNNFRDMELNLILLESMSLKSNIYLSRYYKIKNGKDLLNAYENYKIVVQILDDLRLQYFYEDSKNILNIKAVSFYEKIIKVCIELYNINKDEKYLSEAYGYSQKSKSLSLIENIKEFEAKVTSNIPISVLNKEKYLKKRISYYEKIIYEEINKSTKSEHKILNIRNKLFTLKQSFEKIIKKLESDYPEYFAMKYDLKAVSINDVKKGIPKDTIIIEYFVGDENIFTFVFTKNDCFVNQTKKSRNLDRKILEYRNLITDVNNLGNISPDKFKNLSYYLYKTLLKEILHPEIMSNKDTSSSIKNILIIPDNELSFIPFDSLISDAKNGFTSFRDFSYLLKYFNIIYSYSIILYLKNLYENGRNKKLNILAFAPDFTRHNGKHLNDPASAFRNSLSPLNFNQKEVKEISKHFTGNYFFKKDAIKEKFIKNEKKFSILHFATHSVMDDQNPMYSKIVFSKSKRKEDDGFLHTYEIYSINAEYDLVVLSACNTGYGRMIRGEGIMSIARAFAATGSKNIVMTLWQVNDKSTSEIMKSFYINLSKGEKVGEALRQAKLKYLRNSSGPKALPFYWSPFISFGINNSLK